MATGGAAVAGAGPEEASSSAAAEGGAGAGARAIEKTTSIRIRSRYKGDQEHPCWRSGAIRIKALTIRHPSDGSSPYLEVSLEQDEPTGGGGGGGGGGDGADQREQQTWKRLEQLPRGALVHWILNADHHSDMIDLDRKIFEVAPRIDEPLPARSSIMTMAVKSKDPLNDIKKELTGIGTKSKTHIMQPDISNKVLHFPVSSSICDDDDALMAISRIQREELLQTHTVKAIVTHAWKKRWQLAYLPIVWNICAVCAAVFAFPKPHTNEPANAGSIIILAMYSVLRLFEEICQFVHQWVFWSTHLLEAEDPGCRSRLHIFYKCLSDNAADWFTALLNVAMTVLLILGTTSLLSRFVVSVCFGSLWLRLLYSLRVHPSLGPIFLPIFKTVNGSTISFFVILCFVLVAFAHGYYVLCLGLEPGSLYRSFFGVFNLAILGDFDLYEFEGIEGVIRQGDEPDVWESEDPEPGEKHFVAQVLFVAIALAVTTYTLNIFIAILTNEYEGNQCSADFLYLQCRAEVMTNCSQNPLIRFLEKKPLMRYLRGPCGPVGGDGPDFLYAVRPARIEHDVTKRGIQRVHATLNELKDHITNMEPTAYMEAKFASLEQRMESIEGIERRMESIEGILGRTMGSIEEKLDETNNKLNKTVQEGSNRLDRATEKERKKVKLDFPHPVTGKTITLWSASSSPGPPPPPPPPSSS